MSKQHCRMLQSRMLLRQSRPLLRHCCCCGPGFSRLPLDPGSEIMFQEYLVTGQSRTIWQNLRATRPLRCVALWKSRLNVHRFAAIGFARFCLLSPTYRRPVYMSCLSNCLILQTVTLRVESHIAILNPFLCNLLAFCSLFITIIAITDRQSNATSVRNHLIGR